MTAGGGYLQRLLGVLLTPYVGEIKGAEIVRLAYGGGAGGHHYRLSGEMQHQLPDALHAIDLYPLHHSRLAGVFEGDVYLLKTHLLC